MRTVFTLRSDSPTASMHALDVDAVDLHAFLFHDLSTCELISPPFEHLAGGLRRPADAAAGPAHKPARDHKQSGKFPGGRYGIDALGRLLHTLLLSLLTSWGAMMPSGQHGDGCGCRVPPP